jgi:DNA-directed RNA polymerase subunit M/transcription elongation factor TFIIS
MEFCTLCGNMLYIRNLQTDGILYYCKNCHFEKQPEEGEAKSLLISTHTISQKNQHTQFITPYIKYDPTLPHVDNIPCPNAECSKPVDASDDVTYMRYDNVNMKYVYYCNHCAHFWTLN